MKSFIDLVNQFLPGVNKGNIHSTFDTPEVKIKKVEVRRALGHATGQDFKTRRRTQGFLNKKNDAFTEFYHSSKFVTEFLKHPMY